MSSPALALIGSHGEIEHSTQVFRRRYEDRAELCRNSPQLESVLTGCAQRAIVSLAGIDAEIEAVTDAAGTRHALMTLRADEEDDAASGPNQLLSESLDESRALIWLKDLDGRYLRVNRRFTELLGASTDEVRGHTDGELPAALTVDGPRVQALDSSIPEPLELEYSVPAFEGRPPFVALRFAVRDPDGEMVAACGVAAPANEAAVAREEASWLTEIERCSARDPGAVRRQMLQEWGIVANGAAVGARVAPASAEPAPTEPASENDDEPVQSSLPEPHSDAVIEPIIRASAQPDASQAREEAEQARADANTARAEADAARRESAEALLHAERLEREAEQWRQQAEHAQADSNALRARLEQVEAEVHQSRGRLEEAEADHRSLRTRLEESETAAWRSHSRLEEAEAAASESRRRAEQAEADRIEANSARVQAEAALVQAEVERKRLDSERAQAEAERAAAEAARARAEAAKVKAESAAAESLLRVEHAHAERDSALNETAVLQRELEEAQASLAAQDNAATTAQAQELAEALSAERELTDELIHTLTGRNGASFPRHRMDETGPGPNWMARAQRELVNALAAASDWPAALDRALQVLGTQGGWDLVSAWTPDEFGTLRPAARWTPSGSAADLDALAASDLRQGAGSLLTGARNGPAVTWLSDLDGAADERLTAVTARGLHSAVLLPIHAGTATIGVLELLSRLQLEPDPALALALQAAALQLGRFAHRLAPRA